MKSLAKLLALSSAFIISAQPVTPPIVLNKSFHGSGGIYMPTRSQRVKNKLRRKWYNN